MKNGLKIELNSSLSAAIILLSVVGMTIIWCFGCPVIDDYWYRNEYLSYIAQGYDSLDACLQALVNRAMTDNIRLPNQIFVFLQPFNYRPFTGLFTGLCWTLTFVAALKLIGCGFSKPGIVALLSIMWILGLPWEEYMLSAAFYLNYVFPTAAALVALWQFASRTGKGWISISCAILAAWGHEAAGVALLAALSAYVLFDVRNIAKYQWVTLAVTTIFILIHFIAPAYSPRSQEYGLGHQVFRFSELFYYKSVWIYLIGASIMLIYKRATGRLRNMSYALTATFGAMGVVSILFHLVLPGMDRPAWTGLTGVYVGIVYLISLIRWPRWSEVTVAVITVILLAWHFTATTIEVFKSRQLFFPAMEAYIASGCKPVFVPILGDKDIMGASLGRASRLPFEPGVAAVNVSNYYDHGNLRSAVFLPYQLRDIDVNPGEKVPGDNNFYLKEGYLYQPYDESMGEEPFVYTTATVKRGAFARRERFMLGEFETPNGSKWQYAVSTARVGCSLPITQIER